MGLQLYANLVSQPSRSVVWVLKVKNVDYELIQMDFRGPVFTSTEFLKLNPNGLIPVLKDGEFSLYEGNAILVYLAEKFDWTDLYPKDIHTRAKINQYLHWHHTNARLFTPQVFVPLIHSKVDAMTPADEEFLKNIPTLVKKKTELLEAMLKGGDKPFVGETQQPTVADYACYCEFGQMQMLGVFDFAKYPKVNTWLARMKKSLYHDEIHEVLLGFLRSIGLLPKEEP